MKIFWRIYAGIFLAIVASNTSLILDNNSILGVYYNTTIVFNKWYAIPYLFNILNCLLNIVVSFYIFCFAFDVEGLKKIPSWLFYARIVSELTGHAYQVKIIQSSFIQSKSWGLINLAALIIPVLPSYFLQWRITFQEYNK